MNPDRRTCLYHHNVSFEKKKLHPISPLVALRIYLLKLGISLQVVCLHLLATSDNDTKMQCLSKGKHFRNHITNPGTWFMQDFIAKVNKS